MTAEVTWYEPGKIVLTTYRDKVLAEELTTSLAEIRRKLDAASSTMHVIVDWRKATDYPYFIDLYDPARKLARSNHLGWIVIVGQNDILKLWIDLFSRIAEFHFKVVKTVEQAADFLRTVSVAE